MKNNIILETIGNICFPTEKNEWLMKFRGYKEKMALEEEAIIEAIHEATEFAIYDEYKKALKYGRLEEWDYTEFVSETFINKLTALIQGLLQISDLAAYKLVGRHINHIVHVSYEYSLSDRVREFVNILFYKFYAEQSIPLRRNYRFLADLKTAKELMVVVWNGKEFTVSTIAQFNSRLDPNRFKVRVFGVEEANKITIAKFNLLFRDVLGDGNENGRKKKFNKTHGETGILYL